MHAHHYTCIVRVANNDKSNDYIRYRYPKGNWLTTNFTSKEM